MGGVGADVYKGLRGDDIFVDFDLNRCCYPEVIGDNLKDVEIIVHGPYEYDSTMITHKKGSIVMSGWSPDEFAAANIF